MNFTLNSGAKAWYQRRLSRFYGLQSKKLDVRSSLSVVVIWRKITFDMLQADPTKGNAASIKLCEKNGLEFKRTTTDNPYNKPQLIHEITRDEWFKLNRESKPMDQWGGKLVCRWYVKSDGGATNADYVSGA